MLTDKILDKILKEKYGIKSKELKEYSDNAKKLKKSLEQYLIDENIVDEVEIYTEAAAKMKTPFIVLKGREIKKEILNIIPAPLAQTHHIVVFATTKDTMDIAMLDPLDIQTIEFIQRKTCRQEAAVQQRYGLGS